MINRLQLTNLFKLQKIKYIAFDADDTLWHNESLFIDTQERFKKLLLKYHSEEWIGQRLYETEIKNLKHFGYGIKGFTLSMIETAVELSEGRVSGEEISRILKFSKKMIESPVEKLEGVEETIRKLAETHKLLIITKGDLFDQESKIARSGLAEHFTHIEIVSHKVPEVYNQILNKQNISPEDFMMVGNSLKSDVLPVASIGGIGVHIPYQTTWAHEEVGEEEVNGHKFLQVESIGEIPGLFS